MTSPRIEPLHVESTAIDGLLVVTMKQITDERGTIRELFRASAYTERGVGGGSWAQINVTETSQGAIRGLHGEAMTKLVAIVDGEAFGAYVDTRRDSSTHGVVVTVSLRKGTQVLVPAGVCNGFQSVSPGITQYLYCFTAEWVPGMSGVAVNPIDPALGISWPIPVDPDNRSQLSAKDAGLPLFAELAAS
ncbi:MAG: dTDP-4-dehydrorhamnose 3,5-epimerase family protein [Jatrophihabitans sp.]